MNNPAVIVDIDGTISDLTHRLQYITGDTKDWKSFFANVTDDLPMENMLMLVEAIGMAYHIILCSGRSEVAREATIEWLHKYEVMWDELYMRKDGDHREDCVVKEEFLKQIQEKYNVIAAIDDRKQVVNMWRKNGILCLQCAEGNF